MNLSQCWFYTGGFDNMGETIYAKYDFSVDWGDGSPIDYYDNSKAVNSYLPVRHLYKKKGVYTMTLTGTCDNLYQSGSTGYNPRTTSLQECLWGIVLPKNCTSPLKYAHASFFSCFKLTYFGKNIFENLSKCKKLFHTFDGAGVQYFHEYTLYGANNLTNIQYGFEACKMKRISPNLFKWSPKITNMFHTFHRCDALEEIPQGLLDNLPNLTNLSWCFKACTAVVSVPQNLFDKCPNINNVSYCFAGGRINGGDLAYNSVMAIETNLPPLWDRQRMLQKWGKYNITSKDYYAKGCERSSNYNMAVSYGWA